MIELIKIFRNELIKASVFLGIFFISIIYVILLTGNNIEKIAEYFITLIKF